MDKKEFLRQAAKKYSLLLAEQGRHDPDVLKILENNAYLFNEIEIGLISPPCPGKYKADFNSEDPKYGGRTAIFSAQAEFISAIEDWRSKSWYPRS